MLAFLEKLFIFAVILAGMFLMFLFGMYFDVGDLFVAVLTRDEIAHIGPGDHERMLEAMELSGRPPEEDARDVGGAPRGVMGIGTEEGLTRAEERYMSGSTFKLTGADQAQVKRKTLESYGFARQDFIEMESLGMDRDDFNTLMREVGIRGSLGQFKEAVGLLKDAIARENPQNLLVLKDLWMELVRLHFEMGALDEGRLAAGKLTETLDRIGAIRKLAAAEVPEPRKTEVESSVRALEDEKMRFTQNLQAVEERIQKAGRPQGLDASERDQILGALKSARDSGQISEEEYQKAVKDLSS